MLPTATPPATAMSVTPRRSVLLIEYLLNCQVAGRLLRGGWLFIFPSATKEHQCKGAPGDGIRAKGEVFFFFHILEFPVSFPHWSLISFSKRAFGAYENWPKILQGLCHPSNLSERSIIREGFPLTCVPSRQIYNLDLQLYERVISVYWTHTPSTFTKSWKILHVSKEQICIQAFFKRLFSISSQTKINHYKD